MWKNDAEESVYAQLLGIKSYGHPNPMCMKIFP